jgi:hypothetical protein
LANDAGAWEEMHRATAAEPNNPLVINFAASAAAADDRSTRQSSCRVGQFAADPLSTTSRGGWPRFCTAPAALKKRGQSGSRCLEISPTPPPDDLGLALIQSRRFDEALAVIETLPAGAVRTQQLALLYHAVGRKTEADAALRT